MASSRLTNLDHHALRAAIWQGLASGREGGIPIGSALVIGGVIASLGHVGRFSLMVAEILRGLVDVRIWLPRALTEAWNIGVGSLFIVLLISAFAGAVTVSVSAGDAVRSVLSPSFKRRHFRESGRLLIRFPPGHPGQSQNVLSSPRQRRISQSAKKNATIESPLMA